MMDEFRSVDQDFIFTDNEVVLNFIDCVKSMYPFLIKGNAYCYDQWDNIVEPLFFEMVHEYFSWKYFGKGTSKELCHKYETPFCNLKLSYIECVPKYSEIPIYNQFGELVEIDFNINILVFIAIADGKHNLTGSFEKLDAESINFDKIEAEIVALSRKGNSLNNRCFFSLNDIDFKYRHGSIKTFA